MTPTVYRLAADRKYGQIPAAVQERPNDLEWMDSYGSTALHILCQARTATRELVAAVAACLQVLPGAVQWANSATWTPLHFAVFQQPSGKYRVQLILLLLRFCPAALPVRATTGYKTKTAFHMACQVNADYTVLQAMLQIDPSLATATYMSPKRTRTTYYTPKRQYHHHSSTSSSSFEETPLHILYKHHAAAAGNNNSNNTSRKMALLLEAAVTGKVVTHQHRRRVICASSHQEPTSFRLLHAVCQIEVPRAYLLQVLRQQQPHDSLWRPDEHGYLPLHVLLLRQQSPSPYAQFVLQELLQAAPAAAAVAEPTSGRWPLHLALTAGWKWEQGVRELVYSHPGALRIPDPTSGLLPFQMAGQRRMTTTTTPRRCTSCSGRRRN